MFLPPSSKLLPEPLASTRSSSESFIALPHMCGRCTETHVWALHRDADLAYVDRHRYINQGHSERPTPEGRRESKNLLEASTASTVIPRVEHAIPPALRRAGATAAGACRPRRQPARTSRCLGPGGTPWPPPRHGGPSRWRRPSFLRRTDRGHGRGPALWRRMVAPRTYAGGVRANR